MTAATVTKRLDIHSPGIEVVQLTLTDGETYSSQKFGTILAAVASGNEDNDAHINVTFSGRTATVNYAAQTDEKVTLVLYGNLGN